MTSSNPSVRVQSASSKSVTVAAIFALLAALGSAHSQTAQPVVPLAQLDVPSYMGTWYQVAWFPNKFQQQCVSDTTAQYMRRPDGNITVLNRCRLADGRMDDAQGLARPKDAKVVGDSLQPATLEVSFLPAALRWLPIWGSYWVLQRADDGRYVVVGEPQRDYLWVLSRTPKLSADDETAIRSRLVQQGWDLARWQAHPHPHAAPANAAPPR